MKHLYIKTPPLEAHDYGTIENFGRLVDTLRKMLATKDRVSFQLYGYKGIVYFVVSLEDYLEAKFISLFYSIFPGTEVVDLGKKDPLAFAPDHKCTLLSLKMQKSSVVPIKTFNTLRMDSVPDKVKETSAAIQFYKDSLSPICSFLAELRGEQKGVFQMVLMRQNEHIFYLLKKKALKIWHNFKRKFRIRDARKEGLFAKEAELIDQKVKTDHVRVAMNVAVISKEGDSQGLAEAFFQGIQAYYGAEYTNKFMVKKIYHDAVAGQKLCERKGEDYLIFNVDEFITVMHLPSPKDIPHFSAVISRKAEPPADLPPENTPGLSLFGVTNYHNNFRKFGILRRDRIRHSYCIGKSGSGKSKLFELLIKSDLLDGQGVCVIDPHGDLVENVLTYVPESRMKDVVVFDPLDTERPVPFNPLEHVEMKLKMQVTNGFVNIFKKAFAASWNARLEHVLRYSVLALLDTPDATVFSIQKLISDRIYRQKVIRQIRDDSVRNFWTNEFPAWTEKYSSEAINPLLNKLGQLAGNTMIKNVISVVKNTFNIREIMDQQKILLIKLPKGILGEENIQLLGAMFITKIYQAAMARQDIDEEKRKDFYLYVDEFQNFTTDSFGEILSEARKYHLILNLAHQFLGQLSDPMKKTVFGNVGSVISFRVGGEDAQHFMHEYTPVFIERDLINLGVREFYCKITINGEIRKAFSGTTLFIQKPQHHFKKEVIDFSRKTFGIDLEENARNLAKQEIIDKGGMVMDEIEIDPRLNQAPFPEPY